LNLRPLDPQTQERAAPALEPLRLTLFVSGASPTSGRAAARLRDICERHYPSAYDLAVIDIYAQPEVVVSRGILAVPTLIKESPPPVRVLIGDFTNETRVLAALGLPTPSQE
jgi:circadian clock protein KaiB